jgi:hypothetical protein
MNYFQYFSEIEERFSRRRGSILLLSTLDWALIETWREAGIPLQAVLRGIDTAFDKFDARTSQARGRLRKINGLAWCSQAVMQAAEALVEASTGLAPASTRQPGHTAPATGFETERVAAFLNRNANALEAAATSGAPSSPAPGPERAVAARVGGSALSSAKVGATVPGAPGLASETWASTASATAQRLHSLALTLRGDSPPPLDELDRTLTVLEDKLFAALQSAATETELVTLREQADRELAPYRARISAVQLRQIHQQFLHKRLLELRGLPRLSLFYMEHSDMEHSE